MASPSRSTRASPVAPPRIAVPRRAGAVPAPLAPAAAPSSIRRASVRSPQRLKCCSSSSWFSGRKRQVLDRLQPLREVAVGLHRDQLARRRQPVERGAQVLADLAADLAGVRHDVRRASRTGPAT